MVDSLLNLDMDCLPPPSVMVENRRRESFGYEEELDTLLVDVRARLGDAAAEAVSQTAAFMEELDLVGDHHGDYTTYRVHPVRVARLTVEVDPTFSTSDVRVALIHNIMEVCQVEKDFLLANGIPPPLVDVLEAMAVDRAREHDPLYIHSYYERLREMGTKAALLRCLDRLDNLLTLPQVDDAELCRSYLANTEEYVVPLAASVDPALARYLTDVIAYLRLPYVE